MHLLLTCSVFCFVFAMGAGCFTFVAAVRDKGRRKQIQRVLGGGPELSGGQQQKNRRDRDDRNLAGINLFGQFVDLGRLKILLASANVALTPERFVILSLALSMIGFSVAFIFSRHIVVAVPVMLLVCTFPALYLLHRRRVRDQALVGQLPEALDMIVRALRVGQSVDNALKEVTSTCPDPLGREIKSIHEEIALGIPFVQALHNFEARFSRLADVKLMTTAFIIQRETGGNLTRVLANLADLIRERDKLKRQVQALTAEGRSSSLVLGILPLFVIGFFWIIRPVYIEVLFTHPIGQKLLFIALLLESLGFILMRLMSRIDP